VSRRISFHDWEKKGGEMRKIGVAAIVVALTALLVIGASAGLARADSNGASVYKDFGCGLFDGNGGFVFVTTGTHSVEITNGNAVTICKASDVPNSTGSAVHWNNGNTGDTCGIAGGSTSNWDETVSASGEAILRCHLNGST
jgi:transcription elongation factor